MDKNVYEKYLQLKTLLACYQEVVVAYSGGVDSTLLLKVAFDALGKNVKAVIGKSESMPTHEFEAAVNIARTIGIDPIVLEANEVCSPIYKSNPVDRCYHCKKIIFGVFIKFMETQGYKNLIDGSNIDDLKDYRPGAKALDELYISSPLKEVGFTKNDIRKLSRELYLPTWEKEAMACLSTRISYGDEITIEKLKKIEKAELFLREIGFKNVRARMQSENVRIEVNQEQIVLFFANELIEKVVNEMKSIGFKSVSVDLEGYKMGGGILIDNK